MNRINEKFYINLNENLENLELTEKEIFSIDLSKLSVKQEILFTEKYNKQFTKNISSEDNLDEILGFMNKCIKELEENDEIQY